MTAVFNVEARKRFGLWLMFGLVSALFLATAASAQTPIASNGINAPVKAPTVTRTS